MLMSRNTFLALFAACSLCLTGCPANNVLITNNGPNPVTITSNPSPDSPDLPYEIPAGESKEFKYTDDIVTINAVDMTTFNSDVLTDLDVIASDSLEWDGTNLKDVTAP